MNILFSILRSFLIACCVLTFPVRLVCAAPTDNTKLDLGASDLQTMAQELRESLIASNSSLGEVFDQLPPDWLTAARQVWKTWKAFDFEKYRDSCPDSRTMLVAQAFQAVANMQYKVTREVDTKLPDPTTQAWDWFFMRDKGNKEPWSRKITGEARDESPSCLRRC